MRIFDAIEPLLIPLWNASCRAAVLIVIVLIAQAMAGRWISARMRYLLSLLVLLRLLAWGTPGVRWNIIDLPKPRASVAAAQVAPVLLNMAEASKLPAVKLSEPFPWMRLAVCVWMAGFVGCLIMVAWRYHRFARMVRRLGDVDEPELLTLIRECKETLGFKRRLDARKTATGAPAAVFGFVRPQLLLPDGLLTRLDHKEARLVILHELMHIRRRDVLVNWIGYGALALHWFNPLAWVAVRQLRLNQELACDAAVLELVEPSERGAYGRALLSSLQHFPAAMTAAGLVPIITFRHNINRRIVMVTEFKRTGRLAYGLFASALVLLGAAAFTRAADQPEAIVLPAPTKSAPMYTAPRNESAASPKLEGGYGAEYARQSALLEQLQAAKAGNFDQFIQVLSVTTSDPILNGLLEQQLQQESKYTRAQRDHPGLSPEMRAEGDALGEILHKISKRADGIMQGLAIQAKALKSAADQKPAAPNPDAAIYDKTLEDWAHTRVEAQADYLEYSNILFQLNQIPSDELASALTTAYAHQLDPELVDLASRRQVAVEHMAEVEHTYGPQAPQYKTAKDQLETAEAAYKSKIKGVMVGIETRVKQDAGLLKLIEKEEAKIREAFSAKP